MSNIIQSLWIGPKLSKLEQLCIKSFIDNGHEFHLYTYEPVDNIPEGVIIKNGNEILDKSEIFTYKNGSVSAFSNLFRFTLLYKKGGYWADTDLICVRPFKFDQDIVIVSEPDNKYIENIITSCLIKLPMQSNIAKEGINIQNEHKKKILSGQISWSSGPVTVKELVNKFNLEMYIHHWTTVCSCQWGDYLSLLDPNYKNNYKIINKIEQIPSEMVCIHLWHEVWRRNGLDKNNSFHPNSLYELFKKKYSIN
jgi:hypothetical protein